MLQIRTPAKIDHTSVERHTEIQKKAIERGVVKIRNKEI
jgi:hypothetical protein